jgi:threonine dehydrogenase-like Zn-dependent dehydrogenase
MAHYHCVAKKPCENSDEMDFSLASCMDPLSFAWHVVMRTGLEPGVSVLINGAVPRG